MDFTKDVNPNQIFDQWYAEALKAEDNDATAFILATSDKEGNSYARVLLLKKHNENGFCFFTNYNSDKAKQLLENPKAALVFHWWKPLHRQVRVRGIAEKITYEQSNEYFQTRGRGSQVGAWASPQSSEIADRGILLQKAKEIEEKYKDQTIPCPEHWGGFCLKPTMIEFWQDQEHRLHDRFEYKRASLTDPWVLRRLAP